MKTLAHTMTSFLLVAGLLLTGCGRVMSDTNHRDEFLSGNAAHSVEHHVVAIQYHTEKADLLEQKIQKLEQRIETFNQKPYRDPKGFRRASWKRLIGTWREELKNVREQIVWHQNEMTTLQPDKTEG